MTGAARGVGSVHPMHYIGCAECGRLDGNTPCYFVHLRSLPSIVTVSGLRWVIEGRNNQKLRSL